MPNVTFVEMPELFATEEPICRSDTQEIIDAIKNDKPIPVSQDQYDLIDRLTKQMIGDKF